MLRFALRRLAVAVAVALTVSFVTFVLLRSAGDPAIAIAGEGATPADIERVRHNYGLDQPMLPAYGAWLARTAHGDLGYSYVLQAGVARVIGSRAGTTMALGALALLFAIAVALPLGIASGLRPNSIVDRVGTAVAVLGQAMPTFWFALILLLFFGLRWRLLPMSGNATWRHFMMPAMALGLYALPALLRLTRAAMIDVLDADYIRVARAKGLPARTVVLKHALRNALIPVVSVAAVQLGYLLGGSIAIEAIFSMNGLGSLAWQSIQRSDIDVMQGIILVIAGIYIVLTLLADLANAALDPRLRLT